MKITPQNFARIGWIGMVSLFGAMTYSVYDTVRTADEVEKQSREIIKKIILKSLNT